MNIVLPYYEDLSVDKCSPTDPVLCLALMLKKKCLITLPRSNTIVDISGSLGVIYIRRSKVPAISDGHKTSNLWIG